MKTIKVKWTGIRPLIMSNPQTVDVENSYSIESRKLNSELKKARKKEDPDMLIELAKKQKKNDFMASAYWGGEKGRFIIPDTLILACIRGAATALKKGKDIDRAVMMEETEAYVEEIPNAKSLEHAYENDNFHLLSPCKIPPKTGALMMKMRCMMPTGWALIFTITYDETIITEKTMKEIIENSGLIGVGGWRPKFGRFTVEFP